MDLISTSPADATFPDSVASSAVGGSAVAILGTAQDTAADPTDASAAVISPTTFDWDAAASNTDEMQTLLALLPPPDAGLGLDLGAVSVTEPWTWNGTSDIPVSV